MTLARLGLTLQILGLILLAALLSDRGALRPAYPALRVTGPALLFPRRDPAPRDPQPLKLTPDTGKTRPALP